MGIVHPIPFFLSKKLLVGLKTAGSFFFFFWPLKGVWDRRLRKSFPDPEQRKKDNQRAKELLFHRRPPCDNFISK